MTSKQRAILRGMANKIEPIFQVGKNGMNDNLIKQISDALKARELIKITILETAGESNKELASYVASEVSAEVVQVIGNRFVLYKRSQENPKIII